MLLARNPVHGAGPALTGRQVDGTDAIGDQFVSSGGLLATLGKVAAMQGRVVTCARTDRTNAKFTGTGGGTSYVSPGFYTSHHHLWWLAIVFFIIAGGVTLLFGF